MYDYSFNEVIDMLLIYGHDNGNGHMAAQLYWEHFQDQR
jgi:hypothetical protein